MNFPLDEIASKERLHDPWEATSLRLDFSPPFSPDGNLPIENPRQLGSSASDYWCGFNGRCDGSCSLVTVAMVRCVICCFILNITS